MKILALYGNKKVYIVNTFKVSSASAYVVSDIATIIMGNDIANVSMSDLTIIDENYKIKEN